MNAAIGQGRPLRVAPTAVRLLVLFLRQRSVFWAAIALMANAGLLVWLTDWVEASGHSVRIVVLLMSAPSIIASIVGISAWSPSADMELASSFPLRWPRLAHLAGLLALGTLSTAIVVDGWSVPVAGGIPAVELWIRNVIGLTGLALILGRFINPRLSWLAPCTMSIAAAMLAIRLEDDPVTSINEQFLVPIWVFAGRDHRSGIPWVIAIGLFAIGLFLIVRFGPKVSDVGEE